MKKKLLAALLTGLLFTCTACGSPESPVIPEVTGTPIENVEESVQENAEAETASQQETQTETAATGKVEITTEDLKAAVIRKMRKENTPIPIRCRRSR